MEQECIHILSLGVGGFMWKLFLFGCLMSLLDIRIYQDKNAWGELLPKMIMWMWFYWQYKLWRILKIKHTQIGVFSNKLCIVQINEQTDIYISQICVKIKKKENK